MQKLNRLICVAVLIAMLGNMVLVPGAMAASQPQANDPLAALWGYGETYTTSSYDMLHNGVDLANVLTYLAEVPYLEANEFTLTKAQELALNTATEAARSLGSVGGLSQEAEQVLPTLFTLAAPDPEEVFWDNSFPAELEAGLSEWNLSQSQIDNLESEVALKSEVRQELGSEGLPTSTAEYVQGMGLTLTETQRIEAALGQQGVFQGGLTRQLDRFKASQFEFATVRTQALVIYAQLLIRHMSVRQAAGIEAQAPTVADLEMIADDQLRLLIHVGHLNAQWGSEPDLEKGEGDWWFIERYAGSAANRIGQLLIETQNPGLLVDFFVLKQMETTAITALAGDAAYARQELTRLAELLATAIGGDQAQALIAPLLDSQPGLLAQVWPEALKEYWQVPIEPEAQAYARQRVAGLAYPLAQTSEGVIPETDETNNRFELSFNAGPGLEYAPIGADIILQMQSLLGSMSKNPVFNFLWGVLGGETDYPIAIVINAMLSMIPAVGLAFDVIGLFDPDNLVKFMSLVGVLTSLGEVTIVIPALGQVSGPGSFVGDKAIAVTKGAYKILKLAGGPLVKILSKLPFDKAARFGTGLLTLLIERGIKVFGKVNDIWTDAARLMSELGVLVNRLWDALSGLAKLGAEKLLKYGGSEGGMLLGRILNLSDEAAAYSPKVLEGIVKLGDELAAAGVELSDDAAQGLGRLVDQFGETNASKFLKRLPCPVQLTSVNHRVAGLASPLPNTDEQWQCVVDGLEWLASASGDVKNGFSNLVGKISFDEALQVFGRESAERTKILQRLGQRWDDFASLSGKIHPQGREAFFDMFAHIEPDDIINKIMRNTDGEDNLARALNSGKYNQKTLEHLRDSFLRRNTYHYEGGRTFNFHSDFKPGMNDDTELLKQIDEIQKHMKSKFGDLENGKWNCGKCGTYEYEFSTVLRDNGIIDGHRETIIPKVGKDDLDICFDGISVGPIHVVFVDTLGRIWDPATNTWGQLRNKYMDRKEFKLGCN